MLLPARLRRWLGIRPSQEAAAPRMRRGPVTHAIVLDGTMCSLAAGEETNAGLIYKLLQEAGVSTRYEAGIQWTTWREAVNVIEGRGINRQIRRVYGFLASRYRPGDRIFLFGYSRGAYAVRSLAGMIDAIGLLRPEAATERNIRLVYRHYQFNPHSPGARLVARRLCHPQVRIEMIGAFDTVKALGLRAPFLWRFSEAKHRFHNHHLGRVVRRGYHALALHETRRAYAPVLWDTTGDWHGEVVQAWFDGSHGDVGGQLAGRHAVRPRSNLALVWMLERAEEAGLPLPQGWRGRFACSSLAPRLGPWQGWAPLFWSRRRRVPGRDPSEWLHWSVRDKDAYALPVLPAPASAPVSPPAQAMVPRGDRRSGA